MKQKFLIAFFVVALVGLGSYLLIKRNAQSDVANAPAAQPAATASTDESRPEPPQAADTDTSLAHGYQPADFEASTDLRDVLMAAMPAAESGDPEAMDMVARVYAYCTVYSVSPERFDTHVDQTAEWVPHDAAAIRAVAEKMKERCQHVNDGKLIPSKWINDLVDKSSAAGSVTSTIQLAIRNQDEMTASEKAALLTIAAQSGDGALMMEATPLFEGSDIDRHAWEVVACRRGAPCAKGQSVMDWMCLNGAGCNFSSYEDAIANGRIAPSDRALFEERVRVIQSSLDKNN